jgi:rhomboid protease GluP
MKARVLYRELRDFPATLTCCAIWLVVFGALCATELAAEMSQPGIRWLLTGIQGGGHRFGDLSLMDLRQGEIWRLITSTFVHYSVLHIGLNLFAMYQLGTLIESWYGPATFVFIYGLIGGTGNLAAVLARLASGANPRVHSGGGSVVIIGLVGLCGVAGWRSRTQMGATLSRLMLWVLFLTAVLGIALPQYIDNWGHAGGAVVGALLGLAHAPLLRGASRPAAWSAGTLMGVVILACGVAQFLADRREWPAREEVRLLQRAEKLKRSAAELRTVSRQLGVGADGKALLALLNEATPALGAAPRAEIKRLRALVAASQDCPLTSGERAKCQEEIARAVEQIGAEYLAIERALKQLRQSPRYRRARRT